MITQDDAAQIAERVAGAPADDPVNGWELKEFEEGWLIIEKAMARIMGAGSHVVERESGRVMCFPSRIAPGWIMEEYAEALAEGFEDPRFQTGN